MTDRLAAYQLATIEADQRRCPRDHRVVSPDAPVVEPVRTLAAEIRACWAERDRGIAARFLCGDSARKLASEYGLPLCEVEQIIREHGRDWIGKEC